MDDGSAPPVSPFVDKYGGETDTERKISEAYDALITDNEAYKNAMDQAGKNTAYDKIQADLQTIDDLTKTTTTDTKSMAASWAPSSVVGSAGSEMYSFLMDEMNHGADYQTAIQAWAAGAHSYAAWAGTLGAAQVSGLSTDSTINLGANARAAQKASSDTSKTANTPGAFTSTTPASGTPAETTQVKTETGKQLAAYQGLWTGIEIGLEKQLETEKTYWTQLTKLQALALGDMSEADAQFTAFVAANPTIKNIGIVVWTEEGADWDPTKNAEFMQVARVNAVLSNVPKFVQPDFSKISMTGGAGTGSSAGPTAATPVQVNLTIQNDQNITSSVKQTNSQDQASCHLFKIRWITCRSAHI